MQVLPTALASAEWLERSGRETLAALIFGYEVAVRLGAAMTARPIAHQNGQAPLLGAVAAGARLRGLTGDQMSSALRIGAILVLTPSYTNAVAGATALNVAGGMSGFAGALAPELALAGVAAQPNAIEEAFAHLVGDGFRPEAVTEELGERWEIARNYFRLRACCNPIYSALDALEDILTELRPTPDSIERIEVATYRFAANMREPDPVNYFAAKYSLPHAAAALVLRGHAGYHAFTDEVVRDPAIAAFRRRVHVREDPDLSAQVPRLKPARVTVTLTDGRQFTRLRESARGDFQDPYREEEVRAKFRELAGVVLSPAGVARVEALVDRLDDLPRLGDLVVALRDRAMIRAHLLRWRPRQPATTERKYASPAAFGRRLAGWTLLIALAGFLRQARLSSGRAAIIALSRASPARQPRSAGRTSVVKRSSWATWSSPTKRRQRSVAPAAA